MPDLVLICGSRNWRDGRRIYERMLDIPAGSTIIEGGQVSTDKGTKYGADYLARCAAHLLGFMVVTVDASWRKYGRSAGPIRNSRMLDMRPKYVIAFTPDLEKSRGTRDTITKAMELGIPVEVIND